MTFSGKKRRGSSLCFEGKTSPPFSRGGEERRGRLIKSWDEKGHLQAAPLGGLIFRPPHSKRGAINDGKGGAKKRGSGFGEQEKDTFLSRHRGGKEGII